MCVCVCVCVYVCVCVFLGSSDGKESACNVGDPGKSTGLGCHCLLRCVCVCVCFQVALMVKNLPAMWETQVRFLGQEDPLEKELATHSSNLAWRIPWTEKPGRQCGRKELDMTE